MARVATGLEDLHLGIAPGTISKQDGCFSRWERFLECADIEDKLLDSYDEESRITIMSAFAAAVRRNEQDRTKLTKILGERPARPSTIYVRYSGQTYADRRL